MYQPAGLQIGVALVVGLAVGVVEQEELEFGGGHRRVTRRRQAVDLAPQDRSGRHGHGPVGCVVDDVAQHEGRVFGPRGAAQRGEVGDEVEVAVAQLPVGVARSRGPAPSPCRRSAGSCRRACRRRARFEEEVGVEPFAHQPAVVIGEGDDDRVDLTRLDRGAQFVEVDRRGVRHATRRYISCQAPGATPRAGTVVIIMLRALDQVCRNDSSTGTRSSLRCSRSAGQDGRVDLFRFTQEAI